MSQNKQLTKRTSALYDKVAVSFHHDRTVRYPEGWFFNELLEMPTTLKLLGNVRGKKVLDLGCGTGIYAKIIRKKDAIVKGIDISKESIRIAKEWNPKIEFIVGNTEKLPYKDNEFDIVIAPLVLEYLPIWNTAFREINRVLKHGGLFVFSTHNPVTDVRVSIKWRGKRFSVIKDYFNERLLKGKWNTSNKLLHPVWHHKTYSTIVKYLVKHGFELIDYEDAKPLPKAKRLFPGDYQKAMDRPFFCTWKTRKK
jgi:ubiquinone/menaquinone biosynthesis C-methylase UbiE